MLTVACVYKPGGGFSDEYVYKLKQNVERYLHAPHQFVCITNRNLRDIETRPITQNRIGFWNKLELFRKGALDGPVVYLDLDTIIVGDVTDVLTHPHSFTTGQNFKSKTGKCLASWFLGFNADEDRSYLFEGYEPSTPTEFEQSWDRWGDQGYIQTNIQEPWNTLDELFPKRVASYKWDVRRQGSIPEEVSFVAFHGKPRPHEVNWELPSGCRNHNKQ